MGPTAPEKSAKSPAVPNLFSSITIFLSDIFSLSNKPLSARALCPSGVIAKSPLVVSVNPELST